MAITVEELEIVVRGNIQDAVNKIGQLKVQINDTLNRKMQEAKPQIQSVSNAVTATTSKMSTQYRILGKQIELQESKIESLRQKLEAGGKDNVMDRTAMSMRSAQIQLEKMQLRASEYEAKMSGVSAQTKKAEESFKKLGKSTQKASKSLKDFIFHSKKANKIAVPFTKAIIKFSTMIKTMLMRLAIRQMFKAISEGMQDMATAIPRVNDTMSQMKSNLLSVRNGITVALYPAIQALMPLFNALANAVINAGNAISQFFATITGQKFFVKANKSVTDYAASVKKAGKEAKNALAPFDQLNVLAKQDTGAGEAGIPKPEEMFQEVKVTDKYQNLVSKIKDILKPLQMISFDNLKQSFDNLKQSIAPLSETLFNGLKWGFDNVLVPLSKFTIENLLPKFFDLLSASLDVVNSTLKAVSPLFEWLYEKFLKPIAKWSGDILIKTLSVITSMLKDFSKWIDENQELVKTMAVIIGSFAAAWGLVNLAIGIWNVIGAIAATVTSVLAGAIAFLTSPIGIVTIAIGALIGIIILLVTHWDKVKETAGKVWDYIVGIWNGFSDWFDKNVVKPFENALGNSLTWFKDNILVWFTFDKWKELGGNIVDGLKNGISKIGETAKEMGKNFLTGFKEKMGIHSPSTEMESDGVYVVAGLENGLRNTWGKIDNFWNISLNNLLSKSKEILTLNKWLEVFEPIRLALSKQTILAIEFWNKTVLSWINTNVKSIFSFERWNNIFSVIPQALEAQHSKLIDIANVIWNDLNRILSREIVTHHTIVTTEKGNKPSKSSRNIVGVPRLAKGGVLTNSTLINAGEYAGASSNPEIVTPENLMREVFVSSQVPVVNAIEEMSDRIVEAFKTLGIDIELDGRSLVRAIIPYQSSEKARTGSAAFVR